MAKRTKKQDAAKQGGAEQVGAGQDAAAASTAEPEPGKARTTARRTRKAAGDAAAVDAAAVPVRHEGKAAADPTAADTTGADTAAADKAAEREARRARKQAEREAAKAARQAARQAEREAERAARKAARQGARQAASPATPAVADAAGMDLPTVPAPAQPKAAPARQRKASDNLADKDSGKAAASGTARTRRGKPAAARDFDILIVAQGGGIDREAAILAASLRRNAPAFKGRLIVAEPQPGGAWGGRDPRMSEAARSALAGFGAEIRPLEARDFGESYPHGNKIEALRLLEPGRPFLFLDSDTLILGDIGAVPFDFDRPTASMRRTGTWPEPPAYRQTYDSIWRSLYDRFGLDMDATLDRTQPEEHWERFLYFNAGWFIGSDPAVFGQRFRDWAVAVRDDPGEALACQSLDPWLDQVVLPLVIASLGGGRPGPELDGMDGDVTCHWRNLPLLYARESDRAVAEMEAIAALPEMAGVIRGWEAAERLIGDGIGRRRIRPMFAGDDPPAPEQSVRHRLRQNDLWLT